MIRISVLVVSLAANAAWLGQGLWELADGASSPVLVAAPVLGPDLSGSHERGSDFDRWLSLGLNESEARLLLFATLENAAFAALPNPWLQYWRPTDPASEAALARVDAYARLRHDLEAIFGPGAAVAPEFRRAFRPLDAEFSFLSADEQIGLQRQRLQARAAAAPVDLGIVPNEGSPPVPGVRVPQLELWGLSPQAALEVALRDSARADQLRRSGVDVTEAEYREAFVLLERCDTATNLDVQLATRRQLFELLGGRRLAGLMAARDPMFAVVKRVAADHGVDSSAVGAAYEVLSDAQSEFLELAAAHEDGERVAAAALAIRTAEQERLRAAVGDSAANAIIAAREEFYLRVRGGGRPGTSVAAP